MCVCVLGGARVGVLVYICSLYYMHVFIAFPSQWCHIIVFIPVPDHPLKCVSFMFISYCILEDECAFTCHLPAVSVVPHLDTV